MAPANKQDKTGHDDEHEADAALSFEQALERLEAVVHDLEDGDVQLTAALARYEEGVKLLRHCFTALESAERRIEQLSAVDEDGNPVITPFGDDSAGTESLEAKASRRGQRRTAKKGSSGKKRPPADDADDEAGTLF